MCCLVLPPEIVMHDAYIDGHFRRIKIACKASDAAENLQLYRVVRFFHPRSSCSMHISADVQRITLNALSCITISGGRTEQLNIIAGFLPCHWLYVWFSDFHSCGTYSVLSQSPSIDKLISDTAHLVKHAVDQMRATTALTADTDSNSK